MLKQEKEQKQEQQILEDITTHKSLPVQEQIEYLADMERVYRLRADTISAPLYALALLETIPETEQKLKTAKTLFNARSQFPSTQEKISAFLLPFLGKNIDFLTAFTLMTRSSINVEKYFLQAEIERIQLISPQEAALAAEKISSESALQVDFSTRLTYLRTQFQLVEAIQDPIRVLLIAQKYNESAFKTYLESLPSTENITFAHHMRSEILKIVARAHIHQKRYGSASKFLFQAAESMIEAKIEGVENVLQLSLITSFISGEAHSVVNSGFFTLNKNLNQRLIYDKINATCKLLATIILKQEIQHISVMKTLDFSFLQNKEMENQIEFGFIKLQFEKIYQIFSRITLTKLSEILGVQSVEIEKVLIQNEYSIKIDRVSGIVEIGARDQDLDYKNIGGVVQEILWNVSEISYLLVEK